MTRANRSKQHWQALDRAHPVSWVAPRPRRADGVRLESSSTRAPSCRAATSPVSATAPITCTPSRTSTSWARRARA